MTKEIRLNAFDMNCAGHLSAGLWTHPRDRSTKYKDLEYWTDLAKLLERGKFDGLFLADVLGVYDVYRGSNEAALRQCTQVPVNDPVLVIPAMATVTENLAFGVTCTLSFEPPYPFARRMSTLDHLTKGRVAWNVVTGYLNSAAKGVGLDAQTAHDLRYDIADEYMEVVYKLWEGSWEDDAVVRDREQGIFAHPEKVIDSSQRRELSRRRDPFVRTVTAANAAALPGGRLAERSRVCRNACRVCLPRWTEQENRCLDCRGYSASHGAAWTQSRGCFDVHGNNRDRWTDQGRGARQA